VGFGVMAGGLVIFKVGTMEGLIAGIGVFLLGLLILCVH